MQQKGKRRANGLPGDLLVRQDVKPSASARSAVLRGLAAHWSPAGGGAPFMIRRAAASYTRRGGPLARPSTFEPPVYYLSFTARPAKFTRVARSPGGAVPRLRRLGQGYDNWCISRPAACSRAGRASASARLPAQLGLRASGRLHHDVNWMDSMLTTCCSAPLLCPPNPWRKPRQIHDSVLEDFAPARALGHVFISGGAELL